MCIWRDYLRCNYRSENTRTSNHAPRPAGVGPSSQRSNAEAPPDTSTLRISAKPIKRTAQSSLTDTTAAVQVMVGGGDGNLARNTLVALTRLGLVNGPCTTEILVCAGPLVPDGSQVSSICRICPFDTVSAVMYVF